MKLSSSVVRWGTAALLLLASGAALFGVLRDPLPRAAHVEIPADELLAYDLTPPGSVVIGLSPKTRELILTSWLVVGQAQPDQRFVYGIDAEWHAAGGHVLGTSNLALESRVSGDPAARDASAWSVRLAYSTAAVTDSRTLRIELPDFGAERPTAVQLSAHPGLPARILVRTTFPESRNPLEIEAAERSLSASERAELARDRTSLPFDELSPAFRNEVLSHWQRRLDAAGVAGKDYQVTRLLIGRGHSQQGLRLAERPPELIKKGRSLALNLFGEVEVELSAKAGMRLTWCDGGSAQAAPLQVPASGHQVIRAGRPGLVSTLILGSPEETDVPLRASLRREDAAAAIGVAQSAPGDRIELAPLWLHAPYYHLDPKQPLAIAIAPGQSILGLTLRAHAEQPRASLEAEIGSLTSRSTLEFVPSEFERWADDSLATEEQELFLQLPPGSTSVVLRGDPSLYVAPFTYDPEIAEDHLSGEFQKPVPPGMRFRFARYDLRRRVSLRSPEHDQLVAAGRTLELRAQARLVPLEPAPPEPEVALQPRAETTLRHIIQPVAPRPGYPAPDAVWVTLERERRVVVAPAGRHAGQVKLRYRIQSEHLGLPLALALDGAPVLSEAPVTTSADIDLQLPPGTHRLRLSGLGSGDVALLQVAAAPGEPLVRQRIVYRLAPGQRCEFAFQKHADAARLIVFAFTEAQPSVSLSYSIAGKVSGELVATASLLQGRLAGAALPAPGTWFWESAQAGVLRQFRASLRLGSDLLAGPVAVQLKNEVKAPLWIAAVLVGEAAAAPERLDRFWALEDR